MVFENKKEIIRFVGVFAIAFLFLSIFSISEAVSFEKQFNVSVSPSFPGPNQEVTLSIEDYSIEVNTANILWFKNGILEKNGVGEKKFTLTTRGLGTSDYIEIQAISYQGLPSFSKEITIRPAEVDLVWESDSSVPPFYKGRSLSSSNSEVKFVAMPYLIDSNGQILDPKKLVYKWKENWKLKSEVSGYGKNVFVWDRSKSFQDKIITVEVSNIEGTFGAEKSVSLNDYETKIIFYKKDPLLGILYQNSLGSEINLNDEELNIVAEPFFFSTEDLPGNIKYKWTLNGKNLVDSQGENSLIIKKSESSNKGFSLLKLDIQNIKKVLQEASKTIKINLDSLENNNNLFNRQ